MKKRFFAINYQVFGRPDVIFRPGKLAALLCRIRGLTVRSFVAISPLLLAFSTTVCGQVSNSKPVPNTNQPPSNKVSPKTVNGAGTTNENKDPENTETSSDNDKSDYHDRVMVTGVYNLQYKDESVAGKREAGLNDIIIVNVKNLEELVKRSKCEKPFDEPKPCVEKDIVLFINGREIKGLQPESGAPQLEANSISNGKAENEKTETPDGELRYHLQRVTDASDNGKDNSEHWADLLGLRFGYPNPWKQKVEVSVGLAGDYPVKTQVKTDSLKQEKQFSLIRIRGDGWIASWGILTAIIIAGLILLAIFTNLLRDPTPVLWKQEKPYSLSAFQAAWWFTLILITFIFIWLVTGQNDFSSTALILLSIGLGTTLGASIIDVNKRNATSSDTQPNADKLKLLLSDKLKLEDDLSNLQKATTRDEAVFKATKEAYEKKILEIRTGFPNAIGPAHEGFLLDILSDVNGVNFHRFQLLVWTIILGLFFVISALGRLAMPQFSETLLALMGISAGTYLGFKIPENNNIPTQPAETTNEGENVQCAIEPTAGPVAGKQTAAITGTGFSSVKSVMFGDMQAIDFLFDSSVITATTPAHEEGEVVVTVEDNEGNKAQTKYEYINP